MRRVQLHIIYSEQIILEKVCIEGQVPEFFKAEEKACGL